MQKKMFNILIVIAIILTSHLVYSDEPVATKTDNNTVKIGILHSLTGTMAISETSLHHVVLMAVEEINSAGGVLGKKIVPVVADPASDWELFAEKAEDLIVNEKVAVVFGCWTSVSRKRVLPVFEKYNGLLFYPVQYEGEEMSPNIFYTGATPNQQLIPAAKFMMSEDGGEKKVFFLIGTDYVFPRTANKILKGYLRSQGIPEQDIIEEYYPFSHNDYSAIVSKIKKISANGNACVLSTINGDSNLFFYKEFAKQGLFAEECPIMAFSVAEDELRNMDNKYLVGHLAAWNYFQSVNTPENKQFVNKFKAYCKKNRLDNCVTDDPIEASYFGVYVWKTACEKANSFEVEKVIPFILGQKFNAPGGEKMMHPANHHTYKPVYIGEIQADGQFDIIWMSEGLVEPEPFSKYITPIGNQN